MEKTEQSSVPAQLPPLPDGSFISGPGPASHLQGLSDLLAAGAAGAAGGER
ncbi:hypothetical protein ACFRQM_27230 [Streptomyces sp. NPDC056831]|uniref:hypothetical protein n=1 Tax=Streptomyces sp. NPDC056831 TaxID=3345954 RepID=UPI0036B614D7